MPHQDAGPEIRTTVVVCTRNRGSRAADAIESILCNQTGDDLEVLLVDQSTNAETANAVKVFESDARFRYLPSPEVGTGRGRNMGLRAARGKYVLYTDDDCRVPDSWIARMVACFEENPRVAVVFCNVQAAPFDEQAGFVPTYIRDDDALVTSVWQKCSARGIGAGMAVRRQAALEIGGFDACLGPGTQFPANEEGDLALRALLKGWWVYETARTHVVHDGFRTWSQGKELTRRNWTGIGAAYAKPLRCGHWGAGVIVAYEGVVVALLTPARRLLRLQRPQGLRSFVFFWEGFARGWCAPIDRDSIKFLDRSESTPTVT
jgi:GT2 family glycosyltransferase